MSCYFDKMLLCKYDWNCVPLDLRRFRSYKTHSVRDLLRAIRNKARKTQLLCYYTLWVKKS